MVFAGSSLIFALLTFLYAKKDYDRNSHKLDVYISKMTSIDSKKDNIMLKLTNVWRRHMLISSIAFKRKRKKEYYLILQWENFPISKSWDFPYRLWEGEEFVIIFNYEDVLDKFWDSKKDIIGFSIWDTFGNEYIWKFSKSDFPEIMLDCI